jgi:hypothetical protein
LTVLLRFADEYDTTARVFTFDGLVDGREHLAFGLSDRTGPLTPDAKGPRRNKRVRLFWSEVAGLSCLPLDRLTSV